MSEDGTQKTIDLAIKGFSWNVIGNLVRSIAGFVVNIILARLLGPEPFGIVAIALLIISIGNLVIESGLSSALVQQKEIDKHDIAFVFTIQMAFSILLALVISLLAPWISLQFGNEAATLVIQVMTIILILQAFAQVPSALLRREMKFKQVQTAQVVSFLIGYVLVGLPLALLQYGVWSLVAAQIVQSGLNALIIFFAARHSLAVTFIGSRHLATFGFRTLLANIANWIIQNVDSAIVGRKFGTTNLGFYNRAYQLNWTPTGIFLGSAQISLFSAISRMGKTSETIKIFRGFMSVFAIFFFSLYCLIALESRNIIQIIYGLEWLPSAKLLAPLAIAMPFIALVGLEGPVINGLGKPQLEMRAQWITAVFAIAVLTIASTISLEATAWSILVIYIFRLVIMSVMTIKVLVISWKQLSRPILSGILIGAVTFLTWSFVNFLLPANLPLWLMTLLRCFPTLVICLLVIWVKRSWFFTDFSFSEIIKKITSNSIKKDDTEQEYYLAIDAFRLVSQPKTSGAFFVSELVREICQNSTIKKIILLLPDKPGIDFVFPDLIINEKVVLLFPEKPCYPQKNFRSTINWIQFTIPKLLKKIEVTHFIAPYHQAPIFLRHPIKVVTIIHDICGISPSAGISYYKKSPYRHWINFFFALNRSDAFIYVSEHTKICFERLFPYSKHKQSSVIYPKPTITPLVDRTSNEQKFVRWGLKFKGYFFAFGAEGLRKGTDLTLGAYYQYLARGGKNKLVLLVSHSSLEVFQKLTKEYTNNVILVSNLSNAERDAIYAGAIALVFPSRCEGFGYPILEAMCQGCPPIALENSPAQEIIGGCIQSLDKLQIEDIINFMHHYENNTENARHELEACLMLRANTFIEQNNLAQKYINLFKSIE